MKKFIFLTLIALLACGSLFGAFIVRIATNTTDIYGIYLNNVYQGNTVATPGVSDISKAVKSQLYGTWTLADPTPPMVWQPSSVVVNPSSYFNPVGSDEIHAISFNLQPAETVPVELSSFTTSISNDNLVSINWTTESETGVLGYYILRNTTGEMTSAVTVSGLIPATNSSQTSNYVFKDTELYEEGTYYYWLQNSDLDGHDYYYGPSLVFYSTPEGDIPEPPQFTKLGPVYPNPFNPNTAIPFTLKDNSDVILRIYNTRGQEVKRYELGNMLAGFHQVGWDGKNDNGQTLPSGIYHIRMQAGNDNYQVKAVLMK